MDTWNCECPQKTFAPNSAPPYQSGIWAQQRLLIPDLCWAWKWHVLSYTTQSMPGKTWDGHSLSLPNSDSSPEGSCWGKECMLIPSLRITGSVNMGFMDIVSQYTSKIWVYYLHQCITLLECNNWETNIDSYYLNQDKLCFFKDMHWFYMQEKFLYGLKICSKQISIPSTIYSVYNLRWI